MIIIENYCEEIRKTNNYIALGSFDGLHRGHFSLIKKAVEISQEKNGKSMVFTFKNHPRSVLDKQRSTKLLMKNSKKAEVLEKNHIDILCFKEFDLEFMRYIPEEFIKFLVEKYNAKGIIAGFNYRFGYKNLGDVNLLKRLSQKYNYELYIMKPYVYEGSAISSTRIRNALLEGEIFKANDMLGTSYSISGKVVHGRKIGRTINFPTANLDIDNEIIIPKVGVYYTHVLVNNKVYKGITNIGDNPTVNGNKITIETYILNFNEIIYDMEIEVRFIEKIRNITKFNSLDDLKNQLEKDKEFAEKAKY